MDSNRDNEDQDKNLLKWISSKLFRSKHIDLVEKLSQVQVSLPDFENFERHLNEVTFNSWTEVAVCKRRTGIAAEEFKDFLHEFLMVNGIKNNEFEDLGDVTKQTDVLCRSFRIEDGAGQGKFGLLALVCNSKKVDMLLTIHAVKFEVASNKQKDAADNFFNKIPSASDELNMLEDNYVKMKALETLKREGFIRSINMVSKRRKIDRSYEDDPLKIGQDYEIAETMEENVHKPNETLSPSSQTCRGKPPVNDPHVNRPMQQYVSQQQQTYQLQSTNMPAPEYSPQQEQPRQLESNNQPLPQNLPQHQERPQQQVNEEQRSSRNATIPQSPVATFEQNTFR